MTDSLNTPGGLMQIGRMVREARGHKSLRKFALEVDLSWTTIKRIENAEVDSPEDLTFAKLARAVNRSFDELKAIARQEPPNEVMAVHVAEDVLPLVNQLPNAEAARLAQMIVSRLAQTDVPVEFLGLQQDVRRMSNEELGALLKAIGDQLSSSKKK